MNWSLPTEEKPILILHGDNVAIMQQIEEQIGAEYVDHIICDPPYGVGAVANTFKDEYSRRDFQAATATWASAAYKIMKKHGWNISLMGSRENAQARYVLGLEDGGWKTHHSPLYWIRRGSFSVAGSIPNSNGSKMGYAPRQ